MDRSEAQSVLTSHLASYRQRSHADLVTLIGDEHVAQVSGPSGVEYQIEVEVLWDPPGEATNVMVIASIDDGRFLSALRPCSASFIMSPNGHVLQG